LLNDHGRLGYILPHKFFNAQYGEPLRKLIADGSHLQSIVHFGDQQVFGNATTYTCLLFLDAQPHESFHVAKVTDLAAWRRERSATEGNLPATSAASAEWNFTVGSGAALFEKLKNMPMKLEDVTLRIFQGIKTSFDTVYIVEERQRQNNQVLVYSRATGREHWMESDLLHPLVKGGNSRRYALTRGNLLILFPYVRNPDKAVLIAEKELKERLPSTWGYLLTNRSRLEEREDGRMRGPGWYGYVYPKALDVMPLPKLFTPDIAPCASFSLDETGDIFFTGGVAGGYGLLAASPYSPKYLLGLLNSSLLDWMLKKIATSMRGGYFSFESRFIRGLPIAAIDFANPVDKAMHDDMVRLVDQMLALHHQLAAAGTAREKSALQLQIAALDHAIDSLVSRLYGLDAVESEILQQAKGDCHESKSR
jgi:hypothetical protein